MGELNRTACSKEDIGGDLLQAAYKAMFALEKGLKAVQKMGPDGIVNITTVRHERQIVEVDPVLKPGSGKGGNVAGPMPTPKPVKLANPIYDASKSKAEAVELYRKMRLGELLGDYVMNATEAKLVVAPVVLNGGDILLAGNGSSTLKMQGRAVYTLSFDQPGVYSIWAETKCKEGGSSWWIQASEKTKAKVWNMLPSTNYEWQRFSLPLEVPAMDL